LLVDASTSTKPETQVAWPPVEVEVTGRSIPLLPVHGKVSSSGAASAAVAERRNVEERIVDDVQNERLRRD